MTERQIQHQIMDRLGRRPDVRLFRNAQVTARQDGRVVRAGLGEGTSDLVGVLRGGWFLAVEVKSAKGLASVGQLAFLDLVRRFGGCAVLARSADEAEAAVEEFLRGKQG